MLDPEKELGEEGVKETTELRLKFRYMKMPFKLVDPIFIHHYYTQLNNSIVRGDFFAPPKVAIKLAALQMHVVYGPFMRSKHKPGFLTYVIPSSLQIRGFTYQNYYGAVAKFWRNSLLLICSRPSLLTTSNNESSFIIVNKPVTSLRTRQRRNTSRPPV
jgi:hypothetical protein